MEYKITSEAQFEAMMDRFRREMLDYQRAAPPGKSPARPLGKEPAAGEKNAALEKAPEQTAETGTEEKTAPPAQKGPCSGEEAIFAAPIAPGSARDKNSPASPVKREDRALRFAQDAPAQTCEGTAETAPAQEAPVPVPQERSDALQREGETVPVAPPESGCRDERALFTEEQRGQQLGDLSPAGQQFVPGPSASGEDCRMPAPDFFGVQSGDIAFDTGGESIASNPPQGQQLGGLSPVGEQSAPGPSAPGEDYRIPAPDFFGVQSGDAAFGAGGESTVPIPPQGQQNADLSPAGEQSIPSASRDRRRAAPSGTDGRSAASAPPYAAAAPDGGDAPDGAGEEQGSFVRRILPFVQDAALRAADETFALDREPRERRWGSLEMPGRMCGAVGVFAPGEDFSRMFPSVSGTTGLRMRFSAPLAEGAPDAALCQRCVCCAIDSLPSAIAGFLTPSPFSEKESVRRRFDESTLPDGETGLRSPERFWQAVCGEPSSLAAVRALYTGRGTPASWRSVEAFSLPMVWDTAAGEVLVRCRLSPCDPAKPLTRLESEELCSFDADALARDLFLALKNGEKPAWLLFLQLPETEEGAAEKFPAEWGEDEIFLGTLTLTRFAPPREARAWRLGTQFPGETKSLPSPPPFAGMTDEERRVLCEFLLPELSCLSAPLLERVLLLLTDGDLALGQALTAALGG